jgi:hypothetical protein
MNSFFSDLCLNEGHHPSSTIHHPSFIIHPSSIIHQQQAPTQTSLQTKIDLYFFPISSVSPPASQITLTQTTLDSYFSPIHSSLFLRTTTPLLQEELPNNSEEDEEENLEHEILVIRAVAFCYRDFSLEEKEEYSELLRKPRYQRAFFRLLTAVSINP